MNVVSQIFNVQLQFAAALKSSAQQVKINIYNKVTVKVSLRRHERQFERKAKENQQSSCIFEESAFESASNFNANSINVACV